MNLIPSIFLFLWVAAGAVLGDEVWPTTEWSRAEPKAVGMEESKLIEARDYALTGEGSGYITRHGHLVMAWGDPHRRYDLKSTTKSFGSIALGLAIQDGKLRLEDKAVTHHSDFGIPPESNAATGWLDNTTISHLASQTAGFEKPGGYTELLFAPGTKWDYSDSGPNWLAECITLLYRRDLNELMFERVFDVIGIHREHVSWRKNAYRPPTIDGVPRREFGAGIHAGVDAMARIGYLMLRNGKWKNRQIVPEDYVRMAVRPQPGVPGLPVLHPETYGNAADHYGLLWWNNADGTLPDVPRDAYWSWGLYDSLILVIPSLDIVVARAGKGWKRNPGEGHYDVLAPFFNPIVQSVQQSAAGIIEGAVIYRGPIPKSPVANDAGTRRDLITVDRARGGLQYVAAWVIAGPNSDRNASAATGNAANPERAKMDQLNHEFVPRVLAVRSGEPVQFTNSDPANHNVRATSPQQANQFNVFTGIDGSHLHRFVSNPEHRPVVIGCDIHPWMRGWIYVFEHPHFDVTDAQGRFQIAGLPPGEYTLAVRQPDIGYNKEIRVLVTPGEATQVDLQLTPEDIRAQ